MASPLFPEQVYNELMDRLMDREYIGPNSDLTTFFGTQLTANEKQVDGDHYKNKAIQPWDYIASNNFGFLEGCIIKYVSRYQDKNGVRDLEKAKHFLEKLIEVRSLESK